MQKEYIEREAVIKTIKNHKCKSKVVYSIAEVAYCVGQEIGEAIRSVPAADVVEVRHAKWVSSEQYNGSPECSACFYVTNEKTNYCPHCGCKMDKEE